MADISAGLCLPYQPHSSSLPVPTGGRSSLNPAWICSLLFVLVTAWSVSFRSPCPPGLYPSGFMTSALSGVGSWATASHGPTASLALNGDSVVTLCTCAAPLSLLCSHCVTVCSGRTCAKLHCLVLRRMKPAAAHTEIIWDSYKGALRAGGGQQGSISTASLLYAAFTPQSCHFSDSAMLWSS